MAGSSTRQEQYADALKRNLAAELADDVTLCPRCADGWILPNTPGWRLGVCQGCYSRAKAEATRLAREEIEAEREYDAERAKLSRLRRKARKP